MPWEYFLGMSYSSNGGKHFPSSGIMKLKPPGLSKWVALLANG